MKKLILLMVPFAMFIMASPIMAEEVDIAEEIETMEIEPADEYDTDFDAMIGEDMDEAWVTEADEQE